MNRSHAIRLHGDRIGTLTNLDGDYNLLSFEESYLDDPDRATLSQAFIGAGGPVRIVPRTHRVAPAFLANLLPDESSALRALVARQYRITATRDYPFLAILGDDLPGAVEIGRTDELSDDRRTADETRDAPDSRIRFSLSGAQLKLSMSVVGERFSMTVRDRTGDRWICKFPTNAYPRLPENEFFVMSYARALGIDVPEIALVPLERIDGLPTDLAALRADEPRLAYTIRRFDRRSDGTRLHVEDFNQVLNQSPSDKYENYSSSKIAEVTTALCPDSDVDDVVRRLVFGICIGNDDMHLKNWALTYPDRRDARLAPLYDHVCTLPYFPSGHLALTVGGERSSVRIDREALDRFAVSAGISRRRTRRIAGETVGAVRDLWPSMRDRADEVGLRKVLERHFAFVPLMNA